MSGAVAADRLRKTDPPHSLDCMDTTADALPPGPRRRLKVLLLQLDGKLPNIALMRIAAHHRPYADEIAFQALPHGQGRGGVRLVGLRPHLRQPDLRADPSRRRGAAPEVPLCRGRRDRLGRCQAAGGHRHQDQAAGLQPVSALPQQHRLHPAGLPAEVQVLRGAEEGGGRGRGADHPGHLAQGAIPPEHRAAGQRLLRPAQLEASASRKSGRAISR